VALDLWQAKTTLKPASSEVFGHLVLEEDTREPRVRTNDKIRVAYLGYPAFHKGGPDFEDLVRRFITDNRYEFIHLGKDKIAHLPIEFVPVNASQDNPTAMADAVREHGIDIVFMPTKCPETFNLVCYEAVAGGARVICYEGAGNVTDFIKNERHGLVVPGLEDVIDLFDRGVQELLEDSRVYYSINYSKMTFSGEVAQ
jgi:hypothetical protein